MTDPPPTRPSLLVRIRDPRDGVAWGEFVDIYGPLVYDYGRRRGLQDADAADLTQDVLRAVAAAADRFAYDPARGAFRSWLFTVTRTKLLDSVRRAAARRSRDRRHRRPQASGSEGSRILRRQGRGRGRRRVGPGVRSAAARLGCGADPQRVSADDVAGVLALRRRRMRPTRRVGRAGDEHRGRVCCQVSRADSSARRDRSGTSGWPA